MWLADLTSWGEKSFSAPLVLGPDRTPVTPVGSPVTPGSTTLFPEGRSFLYLCMLLCPARLLRPFFPLPRVENQL